MFGVDFAGLGINHDFGIAVIGGDEKVSIGKSKPKAAQLDVDGFDGFNGGLDIAGVTDHIGVGKIDEDKIKGILGIQVNDGVDDSGGGHGRLEV